MDQRRQETELRTLIYLGLCWCQASTCGRMLWESTLGGYCRHQQCHEIILPTPNPILRYNGSTRGNFGKHLWTTCFWRVDDDGAGGGDDDDDDDDGDGDNEDVHDE
eukprot:9671629-Karenia_brevis.AAC.1